MFNIKEFLGLTYYKSALDEFLDHYRQTHPQLTASQRKEKDKYQKIHRLRDQDKPSPSVQASSIWDKF